MQVWWCLLCYRWSACSCCWFWLLGVWCAASRKGDLQRGTKIIMRTFSFLSLTVWSLCLYIQPHSRVHPVHSSVRVCLFLDASSQTQDNQTRCFGQAGHEAAPVSGPHTSAGPYLWNRQPLNLCPLPDHMLEYWRPAEPLQWWASNTQWQLMSSRVILNHYPDHFCYFSWEIYSDLWFKKTNRAFTFSNLRFLSLTAT